MQVQCDYYIRRNNDVKSAYRFNTFDGAEKKFNEIMKSPVYRSGEHPGDLWEIIAKSANSKLTVRAGIKTAGGGDAFYTCVGKGGRYKIIGSSTGAGADRFSTFVVYQDVESKELYHRNPVEFYTRMEKIK